MDIQRFPYSWGDESCHNNWVLFVVVGGVVRSIGGLSEQNGTYRFINWRKREPSVTNTHTNNLRDAKRYIEALALLDDALI